MAEQTNDLAALRERLRDAEQQAANALTWQRAMVEAERERDELRRQLATWGSPRCEAVCPIEECRYAHWCLLPRGHEGRHLWSCTLNRLVDAISQVKQRATEGSRASRAETMIREMVEEADQRLTIHAPEDVAVCALCEQWGYGAVMDAAARLWQRLDPQAAFLVGPCIVMARAALADSLAREPAPRPTAPQPRPALVGVRLPVDEQVAKRRIAHKRERQGRRQGRRQRRR